MQFRMNKNSKMLYTKNHKDALIQNKDARGLIEFFNNNPAEIKTLSFSEALGLLTTYTNLIGDKETNDALELFGIINKAAAENTEERYTEILAVLTLLESIKILSYTYSKIHCLYVERKIIESLSQHELSEVSRITLQLSLKLLMLTNTKMASKIITSHNFKKYILQNYLTKDFQSCLLESIKNKKTDNDEIFSFTKMLLLQDLSSNGPFQNFRAEQAFKVKAIESYVLRSSKGLKDAPFLIDLMIQALEKRGFMSNSELVYLARDIGKNERDKPINDMKPKSVGLSLLSNIMTLKTYIASKNMDEIFVKDEDQELEQQYSFSIKEFFALLKYSNYCVRPSFINIASSTLNEILKYNFNYEDARKELDALSRFASLVHQDSPKCFQIFKRNLLNFIRITDDDGFGAGYTGLDEINALFV